MTVTYKTLVSIYVICHCFAAALTVQTRYKRFQKLLQEPKRAILPLMSPKIQKLRSIEICYDSVGCFEIPRHHNPFQKIPENPDILETRFYLFRRDLNFSEPQILSYNDYESLKISKFDPREPVKVLVHGYMTKWNETGALAGVKAFLDIASCNVILVDWQRGARGPRYSAAAANTELVGRQLGLLLLLLQRRGAPPARAHVVGFSLGAHVAACAAELVKGAGQRVGRITVSVILLSPSRLQEPCNVILVDWQRGARGPRYSAAAANTELVGRQLGLLLLLLQRRGAPLARAHLVGFSLGAHVAACAAELVKGAGQSIGRITGLDPASPLFKLNHFRDNKKKLDVSDADFVDVIHTDGSPIFTDGFGLLEPLGHVDYFPNGGREQPGCNDVRNSVVVSHLDKNLDRDIACSHIRAYHYFLETLLEKASIAKGSNHSGCQFMAYSCPGGPRDFAQGRCFPDGRQNHLGERAQRGLGRLGEEATGRGVMYLVTRQSPPFCGMQIQIIINVSQKTRNTKGILSMNIQHGVSSTDFSIICDLTEFRNPNRKIYAITAVDFDSMSSNLQNITLNILYNRLQLTDSQYSIRHTIFVDGISVKSITGESWQNCLKAELQQNTIVSVNLSTEQC